MSVFVADVRPRWSDMDAYGHVNHANTVTLIEEARIALLFGEAPRHGVGGMAKGIVVARLAVDYHAPLVATGGAVRVAMSVCQLRFAWFTMEYTVHGGPAETDPVVVTAETKLVPYDVDNSSARRLTDAEREFLATWRAGGDGA